MKCGLKEVKEQPVWRWNTIPNQLFIQLPSDRLYNVNTYQDIDLKALWRVEFIANSVSPARQIPLQVFKLYTTSKHSSALLETVVMWFLGCLQWQSNQYLIPVTARPLVSYSILSYCNFTTCRFQRYHLHRIAQRRNVAQKGEANKPMTTNPPVPRITTLVWRNNLLLQQVRLLEEL